MLIDIIAFILICMAIFKGWQKGLIVALFSFVAFVVGMAAALKLSVAAAHYLGNNVNISQRWLPVIAFVAVFIIVVLLIGLGAKLIEGVVNLVMLGWLNKIAGILLFLLIYFFVFSILLFYANQLHLIKPATTQSSIAYSFIQPIGPKLMNAIGAVIPFFKNMFQELLQFFDSVSTKTTAA